MRNNINILYRYSCGQAVLGRKNAFRYKILILFDDGGLQGGATSVLPIAIVYKYEQINMSDSEC